MKLSTLEKIQGGNRRTGNKVYESISEQVKAQNVIPSADSIFVSSESSDEEMGLFTQSYQELENIITQVHLDNKNQIGVESESPGYSKANMAAGIAGGLLASNPAMAYKRNLPKYTGSSTDVIYIDRAQIGAEDVFDHLHFGNESFDETENREAAIYTIVYNLEASRQNPFGEAFYPTIAVSPDEVGLGIEVNLMTVFNAFNRVIEGTLDKPKYAARNIIRAVRDASILRNDTTRLVPVYRAGTNDALFADPAVIPDWTEEVVTGQSVATAALAPGEEYSLLGLSQTDELLTKGVMDETDAVDPSMKLSSVYVTLGDGATTETIRFGLDYYGKANFTYSTQGGQREMTLAFDGAVGIDGTAFDVTTAASAAGLVAALAGGTARIALDITGRSDLETSDTVVYGNKVKLKEYRNAAGAVAAAPAALTTMLAHASTAITGYTLEAWRTNSNLRTQGQLVRTNKITQLYNIPVRSPITAQKPVNGTPTDTVDLNTLVTTTRITTSGKAVTSLIDYSQQLAAYTAIPDSSAYPDLLGAGRFFVKPYYNYISIDLATVVDSINSTNRGDDISYAIINYLRNEAWKMLSESEYGAALDALYGASAPTPTVIIGTSGILARYLTLSGDLRTLGDGLNCIVVNTIDSRMEGKIFMTFGIFDNNRNSTPNPLNFGQMGWAPEITTTLNISRQGRTSKELTVSPRYDHIVNLPILVEVDVSNIDTVLNKVPQNHHAV